MRERRWTFQFPNGVGRKLFIQSRVGLFNKFIRSSSIRTTGWHFSVRLKQIRVCQNARIWIWVPHQRYRCCYVDRLPSVPSSTTFSIQYAIFPFLDLSSSIHLTHAKLLLFWTMHCLLALCFTLWYYCIENLFYISMIRIPNY